MWNNDFVLVSIILSHKIHTLMNTQSPKTHTQRCTGTVGTKLTKPNSMINGQDCLRKQAGGNLIVPCDILLTAEAERGQLGEKVHDDSRSFLFD